MTKQEARSTAIVLKIAMELSLKKREAHRVPRHKARDETKGHVSWMWSALNMQIFLNVFTFYKAYFGEASWTNALEKCLHINITTNIANNIKIGNFISLVP